MPDEGAALSGAKADEDVAVVMQCADKGGLAMMAIS